jgi:hypothetical protein
VTLALLVLAGVTVVVIVLLVYPYRLAVNGELRGEPDGSWAGAGGLELGPIGVTGAAARGVPPFFQIHLFGLRVRSGPLKSKQPDARRPDVSKPRRAPAFSARFFDPYDLTITSLRAVERLKSVTLDVGVRFSFRNVVLTGRVSGALHALSALLPSGVRLSQEPGWDAVDRFAISLSGAARVSPVLFLYDGVCYIIRMLRKDRARKKTRVGARLPAGSEGRP